MERKLIWTDPAIEDLWQIPDYISVEMPSAAISFVAELLQSIGCLSRSPESGRVFQQVGNASVRELCHGGYRVFYQEYGDAIEILHLRYAG